MQEGLKKEFQDYYDYYYYKPLRDYFYKNPFQEYILRKILSWVSQKDKRILNVGCKIGWLAGEIKRIFPLSYILGLDISPKRVAMAKRLFPCKGLDFLVGDITDESILLDIDFIVLSDVYEHIPKDLHKKTHFILKRLLRKGAVFILASQVINYQRFFLQPTLRRFQILEEEIGENQIEILMEDLGAQVLEYSYVDFRGPKDYLFLALADRFRVKKKESKSIILEKEKNIRKRIISHLQVEVSKTGLVLCRKERINICVVSPSEPSSYTFITNHIVNLEGNIIYLYGRGFPIYNHYGKCIDKNYRGIFKSLKRIQRVILSELLCLPSDYFFKKTLMRYLYKNRIEIVLAEFGLAGIKLMDICQRLNLPLVVYFHGYDINDERFVFRYRKDYTELFEKARALLVVSKDMKKKLMGLGAPNEKIFLLPSGVDTSFFSEANPRVSEPLFVAVSRFVDKKAPLLSLLAFKKVLESFSAARLIMVGEGYLLEASKQLAKALGISSAVQFLGKCNSYEIRQILRMARAFIQHSVKTSYGDSEGIPLAILEAQASGLPVVATRHTGIEEVLVDNYTGFLVEELDISAMAQRMLLLAKDPDLAFKMGQRARERIQNYFSLEKASKELQGLLENIVRKSN